MSILTQPTLESKLQSHVNMVNLSFTLFKNPKPIGQQKRTNGNQHREVYFLGKNALLAIDKKN